MAAGDKGFARAWAALHGDSSIQFQPVKIPEQQPPDWLQRFTEWLAKVLAPVARGLVEAWPVLQWVLLAVALALAALLVWRLTEPLRRRWGVGSTSDDDETSWTPQATAALALLDEADRLAGEGRFEEATHLLLQRSVGQIAELRPDLVEASSTAREIAALPALPDTARRAFTTIAERVERSLFALRRLSSDDWLAARAAYADFALGVGGVVA